MSLLPNKKVASKNHQTFMKVEQVRPQQKQGKLFLKKGNPRNYLKKKVKKTQFSAPVLNIYERNQNICLEN